MRIVWGQFKQAVRYLGVRGQFKQAVKIFGGHFAQSVGIFGVS